MGQAIRLVNKRIADSSEEALSHATILTVGWLTQFEVTLPSKLHAMIEIINCALGSVVFC